jgi:hypothetical protein
MFELAQSQSAGSACPTAARQVEHAALAAENLRLTAELHAVRADNASLSMYRSKYALLKTKIAHLLESRSDGRAPKRERLFVDDNEPIHQDPFAFPVHSHRLPAPPRAQPAPGTARGGSGSAAPSRQPAAAPPPRPAPAGGSAYTCVAPLPPESAARPRPPRVVPHVQVVRKKADRARLPARVCKACEEFYRVTGLASSGACGECSRHRSAFAVHETPPGEARFLLAASRSRCLQGSMSSPPRMPPRCGRPGLIPRPGARRLTCRLLERRI